MGDIDLDGLVNVNDLVLLIGAWGQCPGGGGGQTCPADLNASGSVDVDDLIALLSHWT